MVLLYIVLLQTAGPNPLAATRIILALLCVIVASSLALGVAVGLNRRIQTIAGQPTKEQRLADEEEADTGDHIDRE